MRKLGVGLAVIGLSIPSFLHAMGLGEISVDSFLNQPLAAEIQLVSTSPGEVDTLQVNIAPDKIFQQIGIERTGLLSQLNFEPVIKNGTPVIQVTSNRPITEPFLNFVIEVAWPKGRLLREYTVLLDPPVFRQQQAPAVTAPAAVAPQPEIIESIPEPAEPVEIAEPAQVSVPAPAAPADEMANIPLAETFPVSEAAPEQTLTSLPPPAVPAEVESSPADAMVVEDTYSAGLEYEVQRGDTLWEIADTHRAGDTGVQQMMIALLRENPKAFMGNNINRLKSGYILRMPDTAVTDDISRRAASAEVKKQQALWEQYRKQLASAAMPQQAAMDESPEQAPETETTEEAAATEKEESGTGDSPQAEQKTAEGASELEIVVPKEGGTEEPVMGEGTVLADAGKVGDLEKEVSLAKEQVESQSRENDELRSRVGELEALLTDKDRMIQLKDEQLLDIRQKLGDVEKAVQIPEPAETEPEIIQPPEEASQAEEAKPEEAEAEEKAESETETEVPVSDELMPRIPLDAAETMVAETEEAPESEETKDEMVAAATDTATEPTSETEPVGEEDSTESVQTAALDSAAMEESQPGFFKDLLRNPNLLMGAGFGALLLAGLGWLFARRKTSAELEIPAMAPAADMPDFSSDIESVEDEISDAEQAIEDIVDFTDDDATELLTDDNAKDDLDDLIETAFDSTGAINVPETTELEETGEIEAEAELESAVESEMDVELELDTEIEVEDQIEPGVEPRDDEVKGPEVIESAFGRTQDVPDVLPESLDFDEDALEKIDTAADTDADDFKEILEEEFPESDEVLAEADVYLAYGLNEQAVDLLKPALLGQPARADYRSKLLEAMYAMEDKQGFVDEATELKEQLGDSAESSSIWGRVSAMGKDIAPDNDLFNVATSGDVSLDDIAHKKPDAIDIDLGSDDFNKSDLLDDEMKETIIRGEGPAEFDAPPTEFSEIAFQDTQAIDPADMDLALDAMGLLDDTDSDSAETLILDDRTLHGLEIGSLREGTDTPGDATNEFQFDASELDNLGEDLELETELSQDGDDSGEPRSADDGFPETEVISRQDATVLDSDDDEQPVMDEDELSASFEMTQVIDVEQDTTSETDMTDLDLTKDTLALDMLDEGEGEIPLLSGEDEIDTKLDLAKAYLDMGDEEGAKDALDDVMDSGTEQQKAEAQRLLNQLG